METLAGYREDVKSIYNTFLLFGYDIRVYADLTAEGLLKTVRDIAAEKVENTGDSIFTNYNSLVVFVLSHGGLVTVYGHDGEQVNVSELQWAFCCQNCPDLQNKPKLFFIQGHPPSQKRVLEKSICL